MYECIIKLLNVLEYDDLCFVCNKTFLMHDDVAF